MGLSPATSEVSTHLGKLDPFRLSRSSRFRGSFLSHVLTVAALNYLFMALCFSAQVRQGQEKGIRPHFENAQKAQERGDTVRAESEYRQILGMTLVDLGGLY